MDRGHCFGNAIRARIPSGRFLAVAGRASKELFHMAEIAAEWFRSKGAKAIYLGTITGVDLGPIARYLGARQNSPSYVVEF